VTVSIDAVTETELEGIETELESTKEHGEGEVGGE
jgi:hypothetical protein